MRRLGSPAPNTERNVTYAESKRFPKLSRSDIIHCDKLGVISVYRTKRTGCSVLKATPVGLTGYWEQELADVHVNCMLPASIVSRAKAIGKGNISKGIRMAVAGCYEGHAMITLTDGQPEVNF